MRRTARSPISLPHRLVALAAAWILTTAAVVVAQSPPPPRPGGPGDPGDMMAFEVLAIDPQSWVVTARDVGGGDEFSFRMPPETFRGLHFMADLSGAQEGQRISVTGEAEARLRQVRVERPLGEARRAEGGFGGPPDGGGRDPGRFALPNESDRYAIGNRQRDPSRFNDRRGPVDRRGGGPAGPGRWEVIEFDPATRTATVRGEGGETVELEIDLQAFVGYRFRASVRNLLAGQGFELVADNERPLADCCTVKRPPRR